jgi:hypothetical protein
MKAKAGTKAKASRKTSKKAPSPLDLRDLNDREISLYYLGKSATDPGYAIAYALLRLTEGQIAAARALDRLGFNETAPADEVPVPGTTEMIGLELRQLREVLADFVANGDGDA